jgi:hypothetical protein
VRAQRSEPRPQSGTLQGERGRASFSLQNWGKVAPLAALNREPRKPFYIRCTEAVLRHRAKARII